MLHAHSSSNPCLTSNAIGILAAWSNIQQARPYSSPLISEGRAPESYRLVQALEEMLLNRAEHLPRPGSYKLDVMSMIEVGTTIYLCESAT